MRCSECTRVVNPVVAIDIDGTLGDYHSHLARFAEEYMGRAVDWGHDGTTEFSDSLGIEKELYRQIKLAFRQGGMKRSMPVYDGARRLIDTCHMLGAEVWMTTTRPWLRLDNVDPDTRFWLERHTLNYDALLYDEHKYKVLSELVDPDRIVAIVEDLPEQVTEARQLGLPVIQRWSRWNHGARFFPGNENLVEIAATVEQRLHTWRAANR